MRHQCESGFQHEGDPAPEGDAARALFNSTAADSIEAGQTFDSLVLTVSNVTEGASEVLTVDGTAFGLVTTGATLAFDATGGGKLAGKILTCMEIAANKTATEYSRYGSTTHKQIYIYGGLDRSPTTFNRNFGMAWGIGGWLLTPFLQKIGFEAGQGLRQRVAAEIKTTFASEYAREVSLAGALQLDAIAAYGKQATGEKYLINPNKDL